MDRRNHRMMDITACYMEPSITYHLYYLIKENNPDLSRQFPPHPGSLLPGGPRQPAALQPQGAGQPGHLGRGHRHRLPLVQLLPARLPPQHLGAGPESPALPVLLPRNIQ